jgi:2-polyprenyl-3-methyl-5-hydroxy-6-metoxy-1,4-benzoquinol methylase
VFDVDGRVITPDDLAKRVENLVREIDRQDAPQRASSQESTPPDSLPRIASSIPSMRALHRELLPPDAAGAGGARGQVSGIAKRLVRKLTGWYVEPRFTAQQHYDGHTIHFATAVVDEVNRIDRELAELRRQNLQLRLQVVSSVERVNRFRREMNDMFDNFATLDDIRVVSRELERLGAGAFSGVPIDYSAFEDRCRGSSDELRKSQAHYLTMFPPPDGSGKVLDIGCGRGEMLEVLSEAGYEVLGVDLNAEMIEVCRSKGLPVVQDDGIHVLQGTEDSSLRGIFCAQVVEHLLTSEVEQLMQLAQRKLLPSGVLVVETINPRSSFALGNHFFADTSHVKPVHPETLRFICEQVGFSRVQLEERSPHPVMQHLGELGDGEVGEATRELLQSVFGYQDYAIVATK